MISSCFIIVSLRASSRLFLLVLQAWKHQVFQFQAANPACQDEELHPPSNISDRISQKGNKFPSLTPLNLNPFYLPLSSSGIIKRYVLGPLRLTHLSTLSWFFVMEIDNELVNLFMVLASPMTLPDDRNYPGFLDLFIPCY